MRTITQILIAKLFNNPLGRWYLGAPKDKKIYKITKSSAHYYTGELSERNGLPVICTGDCIPSGRNRFIYWLETWKPIHLCWFFIRMGWKIPKYFIGLDTGYKAPTATGAINNDFTNPTNAYALDGVYATQAASSSVDKRQSYATFGFGIPAGATINGIQSQVTHHISSVLYDGGLTVGLHRTSGGNGLQSKSLTLSLTDTTDTVGGAADLWGFTGSPVFIDTDFSDANFYGRVQIGLYDTVGGTWSVDALTFKVYYTEVTTAIKTFNGLANASVKTVNGLPRASAKTKNGLA